MSRWVAASDAEGKASLSDANVFAGAQRINAPLGINVSATARQPFASHQTMSATATGSEDKVGHALINIITGDYSASTGSNAQFAFGLNVFTTTGTAAGDGHGANITNIVEASVKSPAGTTIPVVQGMLVEAAFFGAASGATVTQMESLRVASPKRKDGATAGTATTAYGLIVESVLTTAVGATSAFSLFVAGGVTRFGGRVDVTDTIANNGSSDLQIYAGFAQADGGSVQLMKAAAGGHARFRIATTNGEFQVFDGTAVTFAVTRTGLPKWTASANAQTTVGAAGGASALPATPTKYLKVVDSAGTVLAIPAYAAS